jgi:hypothetical protein
MGAVYTVPVEQVAPSPAVAGAPVVFQQITVPPDELRVTDCRYCVRVIPGADVYVGAPAAPIPLTATESGLLAALEVTTTLSVFAPPLVGVKVTEIEQVFPTETDEQVFVCANCVPVCIAMELTVRVAVPVF